MANTRSVTSAAVETRTLSEAGPRALPGSPGSHLAASTDWPRDSELESDTRALPACGSASAGRGFPRPPSAASLARHGGPSRKVAASETGTASREPWAPTRADSAHRGGPFPPRPARPTGPATRRTTPRQSPRSDPPHNGVPASRRSSPDSASGLAGPQSPACPGGKSVLPGDCQSRHAIRHPVLWAAARSGRIACGEL